jgi:serine protease Do
MQEDNADKQPDLTPVEPAPLKSNRADTTARVPHKLWTIFGVVVLCFAASFLGAWLFVGTGLIKLDASRTISDNSQKIVLQQGEVIADVFNKVSPSTVAITTEAVVDTGNTFLGARQQQVSEGAGSGIVISKDGYIMTNKHVVPAGTNSVTVITSDGHEYKNVKVVARDPTNDIAFLKIDGATNLNPAQIGDSNQVHPGQQVVAIGNALGIFRNSVTSGIISGTGRPLTASDESGASSEQLEDMLQTDAAINPGNSGGPLVNLKGEVIGMNTAVSQDGQGIGFAIPIADAKVEINSIINQGKLTKSYLGVRYVTLTPDVAHQLNIDTTEGAYIQGSAGSPAIVPGSPAASAGLHEGDIITKVNNDQIVSGKSLASLLAQYAPGEKVTLSVLRAGKTISLQATLGTFPQ